MKDKPKLAIFWLGGCGGCDQSILDLHEGLIDIYDQVDLVLWPVATDFKRQEIEAWPDGSVDLVLLSGCLRNSENVEWATLLRNKGKRLAALGSCACFGGTPGLANFRSRKDILEGVFLDTPTMQTRRESIPFANAEAAENWPPLPEFLDRVTPLESAIKVDYFLPGCPPPKDLVESFLNALLKGKLPPLGTFFGGKKAVCDSCSRNAAKPTQWQISEFRPLHAVEVGADECFLARGVLCLGPATRDGCGASCIHGNVPCRGCFGPVCRGDDQGARFIAALGALVEGDSCDVLTGIIKDAPDWAGYLYRFSQACALLADCDQEGDSKKCP